MMSILCPNCSCVTFFAKLETKDGGTHLILVCTDCKAFVDFDPENTPDKILSQGKV